MVWTKGENLYISAMKVLGILYANFEREIKTVINFKCGTGLWLKACKNLGSTTLIGIDWVWINESMLCEQSTQLQSADLGCPKNNYHKFDLAISVEVA